MINFKHLHYFWVVSREGGISRASEKLHLTPQTISGQISQLEDYLGFKLFQRTGRALELTEDGKLILGYANEIFSLGNELEEVIQLSLESRPLSFRVGVAHVVPKSIAQRILEPALNLRNPVRMLCREASLEQLLAELAIHRLDLVLADRAIPPAISMRGFSHRLGECSVSFFASKSLAGKLKGKFPHSLHGAPMLLPSIGNQLRGDIDQWLAKNSIQPQLVAEFDDSALMKAFGRRGAGIFVAPSPMEVEVKSQYQSVVIGRLAEVQERFYAITVERRVQHAAASAVVNAARTQLFGGLGSDLPKPMKKK